MKTYAKILIIAGMAVIGGLNGATMVFPEHAVMFSGISLGVAAIVGAITGISLRTGG